ncbi:hypothetical protein niasHS_015803 [Heterodera schachtii]|uniref:Uncharacterized protein n=1 Tax=Heterodera schachtii TaxID=97005 RepID=A0ABD2HXW6_HETSC
MPTGWKCADEATPNFGSAASEQKLQGFFGLSNMGTEWLLFSLFNVNTSRILSNHLSSWVCNWRRRRISVTIII